MNSRSTCGDNSHTTTENVKAREEGEERNISHRHTPNNENSLLGSAGELEMENHSHRHTAFKMNDVSVEIRCQNQRDNQQNEEMDNGKRRIRYNPYKKIMERIPVQTRRAITQQRRRGVKVSKQEGDDIWYGNKMTQNHKNFRIFLQNPQGIDTSEKLGMFRLQLDEMRKYNINAWLLPEANISRTNYQQIEEMRDLVSNHCVQGQIFMTNTPGFPTNTTYQPGGVATILQGLQMTRHARTISDEYGRWTCSIFFGKNNLLKLYNLYRVCGSSSKTAGDTTAWSQQETAYKKKGVKCNPRVQVVKELIKNLENDIRMGDAIFLAGDFNEKLSVKNGLHQQLKEIGLINVATEKVGDDLPRTYNRGSECIDFMYVSQKVFQSINRFGIAQFNYFQKSDHRGMYVDLHLDSILQAEKYVIPYANHRRLKMNSVQGMKKYQEVISKEICSHKIKEKVKQIEKELKENGNNKSLEEELNKVDDLIQSSLMVAEKKCSQIHMNCTHDWSPELKFTLQNLRYAKNQVKKVIKEGVRSTIPEYEVELAKAYEERRKWKDKKR